MSENYNFDNYQKEPKKKKKGGIVLAFVLVIIVCLTLGALFSALVINPLVEENTKVKSVERVIEEPEAKEPTELEDLDIGGESMPIQEYENPVIEIAENMGPAVVGVRSSIPQFVRGQTTQDIQSSYGSGFVISSEGYVITNNHVVEGAERFTVVMHDGKEIKAELIGGDSFSDIAVLKIESQDLTVVPIGDSEKVRVGELAVAIGSPLGESLGGSVTVGYISAVHREVEGSEYIQTDAAINPGNSGGPLVNSKGEVVGINSLKSYLAGIDEQGIPIASEGIGFAIPINDAIEVATEIIKVGSVQRPGIGIQFYSMTKEDAELWDVPVGAIVEEVTPGGPAYMSGMKQNDIIIGVNGEKIEDPTILPNIVRKYDIGDKVIFEVWRDEKTIELTVVIGDLNKMTIQ
jgi:serine protease Do